ncbi:acyl-CoA thioesterase [Pyrinomonas methylaliphatogenes]|jgi:acyl-CoA hydrolase|uniref:Acyl-CoA hydrolase n=1 Tax=Pyrinomonas methylaliphatogenes TaxID=454194 RepID=A0A0B6X080_9BACT|nr:acyl-CoA thioesterase [Pyrinomonas methylaliphatogenes]MBX5477438.1 acyl-CoA thioesterase [Pyrinomonas methylaliphatogenes]CDM65815.1 acyl-CoA hydrolase [Pyrinomonas methylaliphatogenes]
MLAETEAGETRIVEMVFPNQTNHYGTLFGGHALRLMDMVAFITASRFARQTMVTACSERVDFQAPIRQGQIVELTGRVIATGRTSVTVEVEMYAEELLTGKRDLCTRGRFILVAVDEHQRPVPLRKTLNSKTASLSATEGADQQST